MVCGSTIRLYSSQYLACYLINLCSFSVLMAFRERINTLYELFPFRRNTSGEKLDSQISIKKFRNVKNTLDDNLLDATIKTDVKMVKVCLEEGANVNCHYEDMMIPLHIAAENGHEEMLNILLKYSSKYIDSKTLFGDTALLIATRNEHKSIMRKLLKNGANVNCTDSCGRTPLHVAALKKNPDIAKLLIAYGAKVNTMDSYGEHVLCTAVITAPNPPVAYALLKNGANINCINRQGMSLLCEAILSAHTKTSVDAVKMLLRRGANVNVCNIISGQTPLHIAALTGNRTIVELLLGAGADTKIKDHSGRTPRDIAIQYGYPLLKEKMRGSLAGSNPVVGKGSFGVVWKGKWRNIDVAVKHIDSEAEKKAFAVEVRQLSRINHPNIVKLYGACTQNPNPVCLVMEYAEGGSLYNVLHCRPLPKYTAGHAMSWALQCANGVAYLHNMKPKALIHRDLKPPNLLLIMGGKVLKICDFGTACDKKTYMTNNKGSAAWMAPEVFEGSNYTEKCDVFSWGIILWEVLSRRKPFDDIGGSAYRIMWAVHTGERPPLIEGCPRAIESLMTRCWDKNPANRPSMDEVVRIMNALFPFFTGYDEPVQYSSGDEESSQGSAMPEEYDSDDEDTQAEMGTTLTDRSRTQVSSTSTMNGSILTQGKTEPIAEHLKKPLQIEVDPYPWTLEPKNQARGRRSTEGIRLREPNPYIGWQPEDDVRMTKPVVMEIMKTAGLDKSVPVQSATTTGSSSTTHEELDNVYLMLDPQLHPISPDNTCKESVQIFEEHKRLAQEYLKVQTEIAYLSRHMDQLAERLSEAEGLSQLDQQDSERLQEELRKLENEKENLQKLHRNLKRQLELIKGQRRESVGNDGWVVVPHQDHSHLT